MSRVRDAEDTEWRWFDLQTERIDASDLDQYKRVTFTDRENSWKQFRYSFYNIDLFP